MAAMLVVPAAGGLVQVQQDGRLASRRAPFRISERALVARGVITNVASAKAVRVDSERRDRSVRRIASPKLRFVAAVEPNFEDRAFVDALGF